MPGAIVVNRMSSRIKKGEKFVGVITETGIELTIGKNKFEIQSMVLNTLASGCGQAEIYLVKKRGGI